MGGYRKVCYPTEHRIQDGTTVRRENTVGIKTPHHKCCDTKYPKECPEGQKRKYKSCTCCKECPSGQYVSGCSGTNSGQCIQRSSGSSGSGGIIGIIFAVVFFVIIVGAVIYRNTIARFLGLIE